MVDILNELEEIGRRIEDIRRLVDVIEEKTGKHIEDIEPDFAEALNDIEKYYHYLRNAVKQEMTTH